MSDKMDKLSRLLKDMTKDLIFLRLFYFNFILGVLNFSSYCLFPRYHYLVPRELISFVFTFWYLEIKNTFPVCLLSS